MKRFILNLPAAVFMGVVVVAAAADDDIQRSRRARLRDSDVDTMRNPTYARADRPRGQPQNAWRYEFYEGRWWYWRADDRWSYYNGRRWVTLPGQASGSRWAKRDGSSGSAGYSGEAGSHFYNPLSAAARNIAGGFNENTPPGIGGALGSGPGVMGSGGSIAGGAVGGGAGGSSLGSGPGVSGSRSGDAGSGVGGGSVGGTSVGGGAGASGSGR